MSQASVAGGGGEVAGFGIDAQLWWGLLADGMWERGGEQGDRDHPHVSG